MENVCVEYYSSGNINTFVTLQLTTKQINKQKTKINFALATASSRHDGMVHDTIKNVTTNAIVCILFIQLTRNLSMKRFDCCQYHKMNFFFEIISLH